MAFVLVVTLSLGPAYGIEAANDALSPPDWATEDWRDYAAGIVAGEVTGVPEARMVVACTLVRDVERGWGPWDLGKRWFGWRDPAPADREAIDRALSGGCREMPHYRYVGNLQDARLWKTLGYIKGCVHLWLGNANQAVVAVPMEQETVEPEALDVAPSWNDWDIAPR